MKPTKKMNDTFIKFAISLTDKKRAIDIGYGFGEDTIFLLENGFEVVALDINLCENSLLQEKNNVTIVQTDFLNWNSNSQFDLIICKQVLHFLETTTILEAINKIQSFTAEKGVNYISAFSVGNPNKNFPHLFEKEELKNYYKNTWKIHNYEIVDIKNNVEGKTHDHQYVRLLATKL